MTQENKNLVSTNITTQMLVFFFLLIANVSFLVIIYQHFIAGKLYLEFLI